VALKWSEWDAEDDGGGKEEEGKEAEGPHAAPPPQPVPARAPAVPLAPPEITAAQRARLHVGSPGVAADANFVEESWD
jgi:hypothetical protein